MDAMKPQLLNDDTKNALKEESTVQVVAPPTATSNGVELDTAAATMLQYSSVTSYSKFGGKLKYMWNSNINRILYNDFIHYIILIYYIYIFHIIIYYKSMYQIVTYRQHRIRKTASDEYSRGMEYKGLMVKARTHLEVMKQIVAQNEAMKR